MMVDLIILLTSLSALVIALIALINKLLAMMGVPEWVTFAVVALCMVLACVETYRSRRKAAARKSDEAN